MQLNRPFRVFVSAAATNAAYGAIAFVPVALDYCRQEIAVRPLFRRFLIDEAGATAIEYALIAAGISLAIIVTVQTLGTTVKGKYGELSSALEAQHSQ